MAGATVAGFAAAPFQARAEEILNQKGKRFLGWQVSISQFKTCEDTKIPVAGGVIEKTTDRCRDPKVAPPVFLGGIINGIDPQKQTVVVKIDQLPEKWTINGTALKKGDMVELFVPDTVDVQTGEHKTKFFQTVGKGEKLNFKVSSQKTVEFAATEPQTQPIDKKPS